ncbi:MAG: M48 family metallopeptidase [Woeseiaceae bacterium]
MRFAARKPTEGVNISDEHPLVEAGTLVVGLGLIFMAIAVFLVFLVELALYVIPVETEVEMFESWLPDDITTVAPDDPRLAKLDTMVHRLSRHWPESPYDFHVEIDDSEVMNAMALPGGLIVVTAGLLEQVETENELAFVLAHEIAHFRNRDHMRGLGRGVLFGVMLVVISGSEGGSNLGATIADLTLRGFGRKQESAADDFGLRLVQQEYGHVADAWRFFERIGEVDEETLELFAYLSTHPSPADRVTDLITTAGENGWSVSGEITPIDWASHCVNTNC